MRVAIAADHGGFALKQQLVEFLTAEGHEVLDLGTHSADAVDYPDYAVQVGEALQSGRADRGVMVDGAGIGSAMTLNKMDGVLAAVCNELYVTRNARAHNGANAMTLGSMVVGPGLARELVRTFLSTEFEGGRHQKRVDKIHAAGGRRPSLTYERLQTMIAEIVRRLLDSAVSVNKSAPGPGTGGRGRRAARRVITEQDIRRLAAEGRDLQLDAGTLVTPLACDTARELGVALRSEG